ncbi:MAG: beta-ketoacyl synthase N-terminal-like domain-containing protein [Flavobacteriales bacterium]
MSNKIYIKAYSSVSGLGHTDTSIYANIKNQTSNFDVKFGKSVVSLPNTSEKDLQAFILANAQFKKLDRSVQLVLWLGEQLRTNQTINTNTGINISSSRGASHFWEQEHKHFLNEEPISVFTSPNTTLGNVSSHLGSLLNSKGIQFSHSITCSSALHAVCNAFAWLKSDLSDAFICGGTESSITAFTLEMFDKMGIYSPKLDQYPSKPLSNNLSENQMILGEGAALFYLDKNPENAVAEIEGIGFSSESLKHPADISKDGKAYQESMKMACKNIDLNEIDYVLMHAPGTIKGDQSEIKAIETVFGTQHPNLFSTKYLYGHSLGASGGLNMDFALRMFEHNIKPNFPYATNYDQNSNNPNRILINASGFGGNAVSVLLKKLG